MKKVIYISFILLIFSCLGQLEKNKEKVVKNDNQLTEEEKYVILRKGTEKAFVGKFNNFKDKGIYTCKQCDSPLYDSSTKFNSHSGWPSFDENLKDRVKRIPDADGRRVEIVCASCDGHLGHIFEGERFTDTNIRHCVNSISLKFIPQEGF